MGSEGGDMFTVEGMHLLSNLLAEHLKGSQVFFLPCFYYLLHLYPGVLDTLELYMY